MLDLSILDIDKFSGNAMQRSSTEKSTNERTMNTKPQLLFAFPPTEEPSECRQYKHLIR